MSTAKFVSAFNDPDDLTPDPLDIAELLAQVDDRSFEVNIASPDIVLPLSDDFGRPMANDDLSPMLLGGSFADRASHVSAIF